MPDNREQRARIIGFWRDRASQLSPALISRRQCICSRRCGVHSVLAGQCKAVNQDHAKIWVLYQKWETKSPTPATGPMHLWTNP